MRVIATAGHVDHGKSTLVRALTGTDPDRLDEEKRRGLTIDLGFAGMTLPSGGRLAFVDVPGHRRFIGNMLAGLGPAPVVLLVVAADQGWQAQSREHLDAVDALGLTCGLLVLTRCGLADAGRIAEVREQALREIAATSLGAVPVVETDAVRGLGLAGLVVELDRLVGGLPSVDADSPVRLWTDRSFTVRGAGTVVTGTLAAGTLRVGDTLDLDGAPVAVRSLQVLGEAESAVGPVSRVAVGLRGVARAEVPRGSMLRDPDAGVTASVVDVRRVTGRSWSEASTELVVHVGTAAVTAHLRPFDELHARLVLAHPLPWRLGDRIIVRDASAARIHCGAVILDIEPPPLSRRGDGVRRADALTGRAPDEAAAVVTDRGCVEESWLVRAGAAVAAVPVTSTLRVDAVSRLAGYAVAPWQAVAWRDGLVEMVTADMRDPLARGLVPAAVASRLGIPTVLVPHLVELAGLRLVDGRVVGEHHGATMGDAEAALAVLGRRLAADPFDAPEADELVELGLGARELATAATRGRVLRLSAQPADVVLLPDAAARAMRVLAELPQPFTTSQARTALGTTRRVVIPLLEHLDTRGWTRRDGNVRSVVR